jgi:uncharacterized protein
MAVVQDLFVYPLKSARGIPRSTILLTATGFEWDRQWMAVDALGTFVSQRTHPKLAQVEPAIERDSLILTAPDLKPLRLPLAPVGEAVSVKVWKDRCAGLDQGDEAAVWISRAVGDALRLVRQAPVLDRVADPKFAGPKPTPVSFTDGYPVLVCNQASLVDLNARMPEPIPMERFRPNIVLTGLSAFEEDRIETIQIGGITLHLVKPCTRCIITSTDQRTGERSTNPLPVLRTFRFDRALLGVAFGENAVVRGGVGLSIERGAECIALGTPRQGSPATDVKQPRY